MKIEGVFLSAADPEATSAFYADALGLGTAQAGPDGQYTFDDAGTFFAVEPVPDRGVEGDVTLWFRTDDITTASARLIAGGAVVIEAPTAAGDEIVTTLRAPGGNRIGLIADVT